MLNADKKRKMQAIIALIVIALLVSIAAIVGGVVYANKGSARYGDEKIESKKISSYKEFAAIASEVALNDNYSLTADIHIPANSTVVIGSEERPFCGTFDGGGYSIIYDGDDYAARSPIFGVVAKEGSIRSLTVSGKKDLTDGVGCAGLVFRNEGTIVDCLVSGYSVKVVGQGIVGGIAVYNYGTLRRCVAVMDCAKDEEYVTLQKVTLGGIVGINYGLAESVISDVKLENFAELDVVGNVMGTVSNTLIGGVSGNNNGNVTLAATTVYRNSQVYLWDSRENYLLYATDKDDVYSSATVFDALKFADDVWAISDGISLRGRR